MVKNNNKPEKLPDKPENAPVSIPAGNDAAQQTGAAAPHTSFRDKLRGIFSEYGYLMLAMIIPIALTYLMYLAREVHPFGDGSVLVLDLNGQYVYFYEALRNAVLGDRSLLYSFSRALGGEFMGIYAYYIASPFSYIVCLFKQSHMLEALLTIFLLKTGISGLTMGFYLHKTSAYERGHLGNAPLYGKPRVQNRMGIVGFSILYALSAYAVVQQHNSMWIDALMWLPMVTYGIEQVVKYGKYKIFVFFLALTIMSNFYIGYMVCIYVALYFFYYIAGYKKKNYNNPRNEKVHFLKSLVRIGTWSLLAVGISAVIILTAYYSLQFGKSTFSNPSWAVSARFDFLNLLYKFYPASYDTVRPIGLPFVYCGILTLMLVPAYFISKRRGAREKIAAGLLILFFVFSFATSTLDLIWHGFQKPNWLNYRYSFMLCFFLIVLAFKAFEDIKVISRKSLLCIASIIGLVIIVIQVVNPTMFADLLDANDDFEFHDFATVWLTIGCLVVYFVLVCLLKKTSNRDLIAAIMVFFICAETFLNGLSCMNDLNSDVLYTKYSSYNNFLNKFRPITDVIQENDTSFYRMEKSYIRKHNDNFAMNIRGLSNSTSTLNADTITFLRMMGYASKSHWSKYMEGSPVNDSLLGIKYLISDDDMSHYYGDPVYTSEDFSNGNDEYEVYLNPYALSIAYAADSSIMTFNTDDYISPFDRLNAMITSLLGEDKTVEVFKPCEQTTVSLANMKSSKTSEHTKYTPVKDDVEASVTFNYIVPYNGDILLSDIKDSFDGILGDNTYTGTPFLQSESKDFRDLITGECSESLCCRGKEGTPYEYYLFRISDEGDYNSTKNEIRTWFNNRITDLTKLYPSYADEIKSSAFEVNGNYIFCAVIPENLRKATVNRFNSLTNEVEVYAYFPTDYAREMVIKADGSKKGSFGGNDTFRITSLGTTKKSTLALTAVIDNDSNNFYVKTAAKSYLYYIDTEALADAMTRLQEHQMIIDDNYREDDLTGTINTANDNQIVFTTIPYDAGWKIYVDGKKVDTMSAIKLGYDEKDDNGVITEKTGDALVVFMIDKAGNHKIELKYMPSCFSVGITITIISMCLFVLVIIFEKRLLRLKFVRMVYTVPALPAAAEDTGCGQNDQPPVENNTGEDPPKEPDSKG